VSQAGLVDIEASHPQIPTLFTADSGSAIPLANELIIDGLTVANGLYAKPVFTTGSGNTIDVNVQVGAAITGAPANSNNAGIVSFDDTMFTVDANGFVQLIGGSDAIDSITGDDGAAVFPDGAGNFNVVGSIVANATNSKPLYFDGTAAANTQTLELQVATGIAAAPADSNDAGIASFSTSHFTVDANGFVELVGGGVAVDSNTGDDGVAVSADAAGNFNWIGNTVANATHAKPAYFKDSATANALDLDIQVGAAVTGAPGDKNDAGIVSFDDTAFAVDADGYVTMVGGGAAIEQFTLDDTNTVTPTAGNIDLFGQSTPNTSGVESYQIDADSIGIRMASPFTLEDFTFSTSTASTTRTVTVTNSDNTSTTSNAALEILAGGTSGGDPYTRYTIGTARSFAVGLDNSDSDKYKWVTAAAATATPSSGTQIMEMSTAGDGVINGSWTVDKLKMDSGTLSRIDAGALTISPVAGSNISLDTFQMNQEYSNSGAFVQYQLRNSSTDANSDAKYTCSTASSSAETLYTAVYTGGANAWAWGNDGADSYKWKLGYAASATPTLSGMNDVINATTAGEVTMPLQPAFLAYLATEDSNVTGNGATFTLGSGNALTEIYDQNADFVTTGTFTAPVTGKYTLGTQITFLNLDAAMTAGNIQINTSNRTYQKTLGDVGAMATAGGALTLEIIVIADMDASDTATVSTQITGGAGDTADLQAAATMKNMFFGKLEC